MLSSKEVMIFCFALVAKKKKPMYTGKRHVANSNTSLNHKWPSHPQSLLLLIHLPASWTKCSLPSPHLLCSFLPIILSAFFFVVIKSDNWSLKTKSLSHCSFLSWLFLDISGNTKIVSFYKKLKYSTFFIICCFQKASYRTEILEGSKLLPACWL